LPISKIAQGEKKIKRVVLRDLMNAGRIQCWHTQMRHVNCGTESGAGRGAGSPTKEPQPPGLASGHITRLLDLGQKVK